MVPKQRPHLTESQTEPLPLKRSSTLPTPAPAIGPGRSLLAPEDAIYQGSPPRRQSAAVNKLQKDLRMTSGSSGSVRIPSRGRTHKDGIRTESRQRKRVWKKLLWVKQSCKFEKLLWFPQSCKLDGRRKYYILGYENQSLTN